DTDVGAGVAGQHDVLVAVAVQVGDGHFMGLVVVAGRVRDPGSEGAIPVAQEHAGGAGALVGGGNVPDTVVVEVTGPGRLGLVGGAIAGAGAEGAVGIAREDGDGIAARVGGDQVGDAVPVDVVGEDRVGFRLARVGRQA